jgi:hypothetical protein
VTFLYAELGVLIVVLVVLTVVFWVAHNRLLGKVYDRQAALDGYAKAATRESLATLRKADDVLAEAVHVRDDTRLIQQRVEEHVRGGSR